MLATHRKRTMQRMMSHPLVLVVQDTTDLNFSTRPQTTGLGLVGTNQTGAQSLGLKLHSSVVLTPEECRDRKSTRLNSSHITISYAVFCLKKKNKKTTNSTTSANPQQIAF